MPFFEFSQNNSGGHFTFDEKIGLTHHVIIEADNLHEAIYEAEDIGIYFNGVDDGMDCKCCGDRWYRPYPDEGDIVPSVYGHNVKKHKFDTRFMKKGREAVVHYKNGEKKWY